MEPTLHGPFREVVGLESWNMVIMLWDPNKVIDIRGGRSVEVVGREVFMYLITI